VHYLPQIELSLPARLAVEMERLVDQLAPEEACGLVAGTGINAKMILPVPNQLHSRLRYRMEPAELLEALKKIDQVGLQLLAIYHSHPVGPAIPSSTDIAEAYYPDVTYLIWSKDDRQWQLNGYTIADGLFKRVQIMIPEPE
jgi:proteasome lid subunit RPN8/RPN11